MPLTTTRPRTALRTSSARVNAPSRFSESAESASPAKRSTRRAALRSASSWAWADISLALDADMDSSPAERNGFWPFARAQSCAHAKIMPSFADYEERDAGDQVHPGLKRHLG